MKLEQITQTVADAIKNGSEKVQNLVIDALVSKELNRRSSAVLKGLEELSKVNLEIKKIKPDVQNYDADGKAIGEGVFTKATADKLKQSKDKAAKLERAINKGLDDGDYSELFNLSKSNDDKAA